MKHPAFSLPPMEDSVDRLVNEVMDAEAEGRPAAALELVRTATRSHPGFGARLAATRAAVRSMRHSIPASPDHRSHVHMGVDVLRPYVSPRHRRQISMSRAVIAAGVVFTGSLVAVVHWAWPQARDSHGARPIAGVVDAIGSDTATITSKLKDMTPVNPMPLPLGASDMYDNDQAVRAAYLARTAPAPVGSSTGRAAAQRVASGGPTISDPLPPFLLLSPAPGNASIRPGDPLAGLYRIDADGVIHFLPQVAPAPDNLLPTDRPSK